MCPQFLCSRLNRIYQQTLVLINEEQAGMGEKEAAEGCVTNKDVAVKLGLKKAPDLRVEEYYPTYLSMAKNFMEGQEGGTREKGFLSNGL